MNMFVYKINKEYILVKDKCVCMYCKFNHFLIISKLSSSFFSIASASASKIYGNK